MDDVEIPEYFICPISLQIMKDPVTTITGITYDRDSIQQWQLQNKTCPVTKQHVPVDSDLTPNLMLGRLIHAWCMANASKGVDQIPRSPINKSYVGKLLKDLKHPELGLQTLQKLETLAAEREINRIPMQEAGVANAMVLFIITCYKSREIIGLKQALSLLDLIQNSPTQAKSSILPENDEILDSLTWVLGFDHANNDIITIKTHAVLLLKDFINKANPRVLQRLKLDFFKNIVLLLREGTMSQQGIIAALSAMLGTCPWGRNCVMMVEAGAVFGLIELELGSPGKATTELVMAVLFHLCSCADGRAQLVDHAAGIALIAKRILRVSPKVDDRAILIISLVSTFSGTNGVLQEMTRVGTVRKLFMMLQADCASYLKDKAKEIIRKHYHVWKDAPCVDVTLLTRYSS